jgi:dCTP deaminase
MLVSLGLPFGDSSLQDIRFWPAAARRPVLGAGSPLRLASLACAASRPPTPLSAIYRKNVTPTAFDADSVDLRLGSHFLLPKVLPRPFYCPDQSSATSLHVHVHVPLGRYLVVPAHQTVLGATLEFIKLPYDVSGEILTKSSIARTFIVVETAPWIHPEYRGCLTLEIANVSNMPVLLYPGRLIGQLVLLQVNRSADEESRLSKKYFGPVYPEAAPFANPEDDLLKLGVRRTRVLLDGEKFQTDSGSPVWKTETGRSY